MSLVLAAAAWGCRSDGVPSTQPISEPIVLGNGEARVLAIDLVEPRFQPALEALQAAVNSGDDREARAVLERLYALGPTGPALEMARGFERILDGRAAVAALDLELDAQFQHPPGKSGQVAVAFVARARDGRHLDARPGPGVLHVTTSVVDPAGRQTRRVEVVPLDSLGVLSVGPDAPVRVDLVEVPVVMPAGALALRVVFDVDLRAGSVRTATDDVGAAESSRDRDLPAMRWHVAGAEIVLLAKELARVDLARAGDLARIARSADLDKHVALGVAVRIPPAERADALDELAREWETLSEPTLLALAPALRWLASEANLGEDADAWRAFLRERARRSSPESDLRLPRARSGVADAAPDGP